MLPRMRNTSCEVRYEELVEDLEGASRRVLAFLGVEWDERVLQFHEHARSKPVRSSMSPWERVLSSRSRRSRVPITMGVFFHILSELVN